MTFTDEQLHNIQGLDREGATARTSSGTEVAEADPTAGARKEAVGGWQIWLRRRKG